MTAARPQWGRSLLATAAIGVGLMAAVDEIVFHQLLAWHHFYDRSTPQVGLPPTACSTPRKLVYYGGDPAELLLAAALFAGWYHRRRPTPVRAGRFTDSEDGKRVPDSHSWR